MQLRADFLRLRLRPALHSVRGSAGDADTSAVAQSPLYLTSPALYGRAPGPLLGSESENLDSNVEAGVPACRLGRYLSAPDLSHIDAATARCNEAPGKDVRELAVAPVGASSGSEPDIDAATARHTELPGKEAAETGRGTEARNAKSLWRKLRQRTGLITFVLLMRKRKLVATQVRCMHVCRCASMCHALDACVNMHTIYTHTSMHVQVRAVLEQDSLDLEKLQALLHDVEKRKTPRASL
jgi:hypothetical protein